MHTYSVQGYWSKIQKFLKDNNFEIDLTYYRISFGILDNTNDELHHSDSQILYICIKV